MIRAARIRRLAADLPVTLPRTRYRRTVVRRLWCSQVSLRTELASAGLCPGSVPCVQGKELRLLPLILACLLARTSGRHAEKFLAQIRIVTKAAEHAAGDQVAVG